MMGPSSSSDIGGLRGQFMAALESQKEEMTLFKNKLPLTSTLKQFYGLPKNTTLKFHYKYADMLLEDYHQSLMKFQDRKEKNPALYISKCIKRLRINRIQLLSVTEKKIP